MTNKATELVVRYTASVTRISQLHYQASAVIAESTRLVQSVSDRPGFRKTPGTVVERGIKEHAQELRRIYREALETLEEIA